MENKRLTTILVIGLMLLIFSIAGAYDNDLLSGRAISENIRDLDYYKIGTVKLYAGGNAFKLDNDIVGHPLSDISERLLMNNKGRILFIYNNPKGSFQCNDNGCRTIYIPYGSPWETRIPNYQRKGFYSTSADISNEHTIFVYFSPFLQKSILRK
ncbi:MAG TPA: hypothetical protein VJB94_02375 [Candidatus Nanoarchaeia archaeon]|nr:hypothetical protein [Candidatus Nanoarchaeia archaeon]